MVQGVRGQGVRGENRGLRDCSLRLRLFAASSVSVTTTSARYCASLSLHSTKGEFLKVRASCTNITFSSASSQQLMTDSTAAAAIVLTQNCRRLQAQVGSRRPFQTDRSMHAGSTVSLGRLIPNRPTQSSFQTSVPKTLAESPSDVMARYIHG